jgi:GNAT superfamily N-acetyltransferase
MALKRFTSCPASAGMTNRFLLNRVVIEKNGSGLVSYRCLIRKPKNSGNNMDSEKIDIKLVHLKDLYQFAKNFIDSRSFDGVIPMTLSRAKAQAKNPYSQPDDVVLFVAYKNSQAIGYIGRFPGILSFEKKHYRMFWGSTFYLKEKYRGKGIGEKLLNKMMSLNQDFAVTRITPQADKVLNRYGLKTLGSLTYFQLRVERVHYFDKLFTSLKKTSIGKNAGSRNLAKKFEESIYKLEKRLFYEATSGFINKMSYHYKYLTTNKLKESDFFLEQHLHQPFFYRGPELINWMLQEKWVLSQGDKIHEVSGYHFSGVRKFFNYIALKLYYKNLQNYNGFIILCVSSYKSKTVLRVLDHLFKSSDVISGACAAVLKYAKKYQADRIEFSDKMGEYLKNQIYFKRFLKKQNRIYRYFPAHENSPLERAKEMIQFDYCDGDIAFT